ncbi:MAG: hypothetical protein V9E89_06315 [Ilumatobacteraceae bacterium]
MIPYSNAAASETTVSKMVEAMARPASCGVPRRPTMAVSTSTYSGSTARVPRAGTARPMIRRRTARSSATVVTEHLAGRDFR